MTTSDLRPSGPATKTNRKPARLLWAVPVVAVAAYGGLAIYQLGGFDGWIESGFPKEVDWATIRVASEGGWFTRDVTVDVVASESEDPSADGSKDEDELIMRLAGTFRPGLTPQLRLTYAEGTPFADQILDKLLTETGATLTVDFTTDMKPENTTIRWKEAASGDQRFPSVEATLRFDGEALAALDAADVKPDALGIRADFKVGPGQIWDYAMGAWTMTYEYKPKTGTALLDYAFDGDKLPIGDAEEGGVLGMAPGVTTGPVRLMVKAVHKPETDGKTAGTGEEKGTEKADPASSSADGGRSETDIVFNVDDVRLEEGRLPAFSWKFSAHVSTHEGFWLPCLFTSLTAGSGSSQSVPGICPAWAAPGIFQTPLSYPTKVDIQEGEVRWTGTRIDLTGTIENRLEASPAERSENGDDPEDLLSEPSLSMDIKASAEVSNDKEALQKLDPAALFTASLTKKLRALEKMGAVKVESPADAKEASETSNASERAARPTRFTTRIALSPDDPASPEVKWNGVPFSRVAPVLDADDDMTAAAASGGPFEVKVVAELDKPLPNGQTLGSVIAPLERSLNELPGIDQISSSLSIGGDAGSTWVLEIVFAPDVDREAMYDALDKRIQAFADNKPEGVRLMLAVKKPETGDSAAEENVPHFE